MKIKLFWQENCRKCPAAKEAVTGFDDVELLNIEDSRGLAEATFYGIMSTPSIIIVDDKDEMTMSWHGQVPEVEELRRWISA